MQEELRFGISEGTRSRFSAGFLGLHEATGRWLVSVDAIGRFKSTSMPACGATEPRVVTA